MLFFLKPDPKNSVCHFKQNLILGQAFTLILIIKPIRDLTRPQCKANQTHCTAGEALLTLCDGLWARAQGCHQNRKKKITWSYGFEARLRAAM